MSRIRRLKVLQTRHAYNLSEKEVLPKTREAVLRTEREGVDRGTANVQRQEISKCP